MTTINVFHSHDQNIVVLVDNRNFSAILATLQITSYALGV
jgi:hypothetical protein